MLTLGGAMTSDASIASISDSVDYHFSDVYEGVCLDRGVDAD